MKLNRNLRFYSILKLTILFSTAWALSACSRSVPEKLQLQIAVPTSQSVNQSLSAQGTPVEQLEFVILNLRATPTSTPKIIEFEFNGAPPSPLTLTVQSKDIPLSAGLIVQYLGGFKNNTNGSLRFSYGDTTVNSNVNGDINAVIAAQMFGASSGKEVHFGGRYMTSSNSGPTAGLITYFQPPTAGKPLMAVERREMINGWFSAFALEDGGTNSPKFTYSLLNYATNTETVLWQDINSASPMFSKSSPDNMIEKWQVSPHFRLENEGNNFGVEADAGGWYIAGYWGSSGFLSASTMSVTDMSLTPYALNDLSANADFSQPLGFFASDYSTTVPGVRLVDNVSDVERSPTSMHMVFTPEAIGRSGSGSSEVFGFKAPFKLYQPEDTNYPFLSASPAAADSVDLNWAYLNLQTGSVMGSEIFYRSYSGGWGNNNGDDKSLDRPLDCKTQLIAKGWQKYGHELSGSMNFVNLEGPPSAGNPKGTGGLTGFGHAFAICPYRMVNSVREYYPTYAETSCIGGCFDTRRQLFSFGRKIPGYGASDKYISTPALVTAHGGVAVRATSIAPDGPDYIFSYPTNSTFDANVVDGDEVMIVTNGQAGTGCGGPNAGHYEFAHVITADSNQTTVHLADNSMYRNLISSNMDEVHTSANFCYVQLVRVIEVGDLTIASGANFNAASFYWGADGGGIVALRVNGKIRFQGTVAGNYNMISASGTGYPGAAGGQNPGDSRGGMYAPNSSISTGAGGAGVTSGSGGGGANVGSGGLGETVGASTANGGLTIGTLAGFQNAQISMNFGAGGGSSSAVGGGNGGGAIFISARAIEVYGANGNQITANGNPASNAGPGNATGGGGAGGSVNIHTLNVRNWTMDAAGLLVFAKGGDGGTYSGETTGGGGGGGHIITRVCPFSEQTAFAGIGIGYDNYTSPTAMAPAVVAGGPSVNSNANAFSTPGGLGLLNNKWLSPFCSNN